MIFRIITFLVLLLPVYSLGCIAAEKNSSLQTVEMSLNYYHFQYEEAIPSQETSWIPGYRISYKNQDLAAGTFWRVMHETSTHDTHYSGATQMGTDLETTSDNKLNTTELILAKPINSSKTAYAYLGVGSHNWDRTLTGAGGYLEKYSWNYIPVGYRNEFRLNDRWDGAVDISLRFMFGGKMKAYFPNYFDPFRVELGSKTGFKLEFPFTYHVNNKWALILNPYYEYWGIKESNTVPLTSGGQLITDVAEPDSHTNKYGFNIGFIHRL